MIAHANDHLDFEHMTGASGGLVFIIGIGAITGPVVIGWIMLLVGQRGYSASIPCLSFSLALYAAYLMTQRAAVSVDDTESHTPINLGALVVAVELARQHAIGVAKDETLQFDNARRK